MSAILKKGWGYWDTTCFPYGGSFRRAAKDTEIELTGERDERKGLEFRIGDRTGWADFEAVQRVD